jgi:hypothetical protein
VHNIGASYRIYIYNTCSYLPYISCQKTPVLVYQFAPHLEVGRLELQGLKVHSSVAFPGAIAWTFTDSASRSACFMAGHTVLPAAWERRSSAGRGAASAERSRTEDTRGFN